MDVSKKINSHILQKLLESFVNNIHKIYFNQVKFQIKQEYNHNAAENQQTTEKTKVCINVQNLTLWKKLSFFKDML